MKKILPICSFLIFFNAFSQTETETSGTMEATSKSLMLDSGGSKFIIKGTSSLHDWEMVSESFKGSIAYEGNPDQLSLKEIRITVGVKSLKSGKRIMDNKCYDALKYETNPNIEYRFVSVGSLKPSGNHTYTATLNGTLTIAGKSKSVPIDVTISVSENQLAIKGAKPLKMTDFDVEPPTALLGTLKTGDDIVIDFNLNYR